MIKNTTYHYASLTIVVVLLSLIIFEGCNKEIGEFLLGDLKNENPFTGTETLIYIDSNGDSIVFNGDGRYSELFHTEPHYGKEDYYVNEGDYCSFTELHEKYKISIYLQSHLNTALEMQLRITDMVYPEGDTCNSYTYFNIPLMENLWHTRFYLDTLFVLDRYYHNVFVDSSMLYSCTNKYNFGKLNKAVAIFYTTTDGIIKIDFEDDTSWELKEIIQ